MARTAAPKKAVAVIDSTATGGKSSSKAMSTIDQELAAEIANIKNEIGQASGNKIKVEPSGNFILPDGMNLGNEIQIVVVDFATHHDFYDAPYNSQNPTPPVCYARGKDLTTLAPEPDSPDIQSEKCSTCPMNAFGSGSNGKSKACKNSRVLAVLLVDPEDPDAINASDAPIYTLQLPPTAIKSFDGAASHIARTLLGPPIKAVLTVIAKPVGTYALISFIDPVPNTHYALHAARRPETIDMLYRKPDFAAYDAKQPTPRGRAAPARGRAAPAARR